MWKLVAILLAGNGWIVQVQPIATYASALGCSGGKAAFVRAESTGDLRSITASRVLACIPGQ